MIVTRVVIDGWKSFTFDIDFHPGMNILIGMNGCGKTTILDLIAGLTGTDRATELLEGKFRFIRLDVSWPINETVTETPRKKTKTVTHRHETIMLRDDFKSEESQHEIARFKKLLPVRTSYVLRHDLYDDRYLGQAADRETNIKETIRYLDGWDLGIKKQLRVHPNYAHYMLSDTGAQRYLLTVGMRITEEDTPMLVDMPERSLHPVLLRRIHEYYGRYRDTQQVIYATHSPEIVASVADRFDTYNWHNQTPAERSKHKTLFDLHDKKNTTLRDGYDVE